MQADFNAVIGANTSMVEEALAKLAAKPLKLNLSIAQSSSGALGQIRSQLGEFDKSLAASNARVLAFSASAGAMFAVTRSLKEMVRVTVEVERKMTSINSILGAGRSEFQKFGGALFKIARDTSTSFAEVADAAEELARQGVGIEETLKRTSSAMKLAKVSGVDVRTAVDAITAALNSNNDAWLDSEKLINKLVAVDAKFAVSAGGLAEAIKRVGSVASDAGLGIDDLIAAITSAQQTTARGEAVIGNALKTIFTRAQRPKVLEDFESLGIATKDAIGNIQPLSRILVDVAKKYDDLSSAQQQNVSELVGGVYQINILKALFRDLGKETSFFSNALKTSQGATNEADTRIGELNQTLDALFKKFTVNLTQVGSQVGGDIFAPLFKNLLKGANSGLEEMAREVQGESGNFLGKFLEGAFKGIGNVLSGPVLIGGFVLLTRSIAQTARESKDAITTLAGLNKSFHSLQIATADANNFLKQNPKLLLDIVVASKSAEGATKAIAIAQAAYNQQLATTLLLNEQTARFAPILAKQAAQSGVFFAPVGGRETVQRKKAAVGLIPEREEKAGAYAGGYTPGAVREMNVPGMGTVYYNTAENVKQFPGMAQPAIMPPQNSRAGQNYEREFGERHGFNPYMSEGLIPNFNSVLFNKKMRGLKNDKVSFYGYPTDPKTWHLDGIIANQPGKGHGSALMQKMVATADKTKTNLTLMPVSSEEGLSDKKLADWYSRFGFKVTEQHGNDIFEMKRGNYAKGMVPNFSSLSDAISRESVAVNPGIIRVGSHSALRGPGNPDGMGVYNLRDEPLGLGQGVQRAKSMGLNPRTHGIPNYVAPPSKISAAIGRITKPFIGDETSKQPDDSFRNAMGASIVSGMVSSFGGDSQGSKIAQEATSALSLYYTLSTFLKGSKGPAAAGTLAAVTGAFGAFKQFTNSFTTLQAEIDVLKDNIQKSSNGLNNYATTLEHLQESYLDNNIGADKIGKLQEKLSKTLFELPAELRQKLIGAKGGAQTQEIIGKYTSGQETKMREKEFALGLSTKLNSWSSFGSLLNFGEKTTNKAGQEKLDFVATTLLNLLGEEGLKKAGGAEALKSGDLLTKLEKGGISEPIIKELRRTRDVEKGYIQSKMADEGKRVEKDLESHKAGSPNRQRDIEQANRLDLQMKGVRKTIKQTFETIGQMANLKIAVAGRRGLMNATGIGEQIQGTANLMSETNSPEQAALTSYKAQMAANQLRAAEGISGVFGGLRGGISSLYSNTDLSRMGEIPTKMRTGQKDLMNILGGSSVSGISEESISLFKSVGKDGDIADIRKLTADSNERLVDIYQTLEEQNKLAEIQKNIALQRVEFDRTLKTGGGLGSFMDRGVKMQQLTDIYGAKFGEQSGIFKGQGSIDLLKSFMGAGGKVGAPGFDKLLITATEERAHDIISTQKDLNQAFSGTGLSLAVPSLREARGIAGTQIAAELKTGDSAMEKQMAQQQAALQNALSTSMGGQFNSAAEIFGKVLAGSSTFVELNKTLNLNQQLLQRLDAQFKALRPTGDTLGDAPVGVRASGNIPIAAATTEKLMAKAGGYNAGYLRRAGNLIYNSAEKVDYLPGVREPVISPPPGSLAGFLHKQKMAGLGFAAEGDFLSSLSQEEFSKWMQSASKEDLTKVMGSSSSRYYDALTRKPEFRSSPPVFSFEQKDAAYVRMEKLAKKMQNYADPNETSGWARSKFGENLSNSHETHKGYVTFKNAEDFTPEKLEKFQARLNESKFSGQVKVLRALPFSADRFLGSFDNLVYHGRSQDEVAKAEKIAREIFGEKGISHSRGLDIGGLSHSESLAQTVGAGRVKNIVEQGLKPSILGEQITPQMASGAGVPPTPVGRSGIAPINFDETPSVIRPTLEKVRGVPPSARKPFPTFKQTYLYIPNNPSIDDRLLAKREGYELLGNEERVAIAEGKIKLPKGSKIIDPTGAFSTVGTEQKTVVMPKNALKNLSVISPTDPQFPDKLAEAKEMTGMGKSGDLHEFLKRNEISTKGKIEISKHQALLEKEFGKGFFIKKKMGLQSEGVFSQKPLFEGQHLSSDGKYLHGLPSLEQNNPLIKPKDFFVQSGVKNTSNRVFRVNTMGTELGAKTLTKAQLRMVDGTLVYDAFSATGELETSYLTPKEILNNERSSRIAEAQARRSMASLPASRRVGSLAGMDVAETGHTGIMKRLQLLAEETGVGYKLFKGGGVVEPNFANDRGYPGSLRVTETSIAVAKELERLEAAKLLPHQSRNASSPVKRIRLRDEKGKFVAGNKPAPGADLNPRPGTGGQLNIGPTRDPLGIRPMVNGIAPGIVISPDGTELPTSYDRNPSNYADYTKSPELVRDITGKPLPRNFIGPRLPTQVAPSLSQPGQNLSPRSLTKDLVSAAKPFMPPPSQLKVGYTGIGLPTSFKPKDIYNNVKSAGLKANLKSLGKIGVGALAGVAGSVLFNKFAGERGFFDQQKYDELLDSKEYKNATSEEEKRAVLQKSWVTGDDLMNENKLSWLGRAASFVGLGGAVYDPLKSLMALQVDKIHYTSGAYQSGVDVGTAEQKLHLSNLRHAPRKVAKARNLAAAKRMDDIRNESPIKNGQFTSRAAFLEMMYGNENKGTVGEIDLITKSIDKANILATMYGIGNNIPKQYRFDSNLADGKGGVGRMVEVDAVAQQREIFKRQVAKEQKAGTLDSYLAKLRKPIYTFEQAQRTEEIGSLRSGLNILEKDSPERPTYEKEIRDRENLNKEDFIKLNTDAIAKIYNIRDPKQLEALRIGVENASKNGSAGLQKYIGLFGRPPAADEDKSENRAGGNIPIAAAATERLMAKRGGYTAGYPRRAGNLIYNSAEKVDYLPGVREPVISPPPGSLAGFLHKQKMGGMGFAAAGKTPPVDINVNRLKEVRDRQEAIVKSNADILAKAYNIKDSNQLKALQTGVRNASEGGASGLQKYIQSFGKAPSPEAKEKAPEKKPENKDVTGQTKLDINLNFGGNVEAKGNAADTAAIQDAINQISKQLRDEIMAIAKASGASAVAALANVRNPAPGQFE